MSNVVLTLHDSRSLRVPVYGQIAAGRPLDDASVIGWRDIRLPRDYKPGQRYCAVIVRGDSLARAGILSGDYAILRMQNTLSRNGELAAVMTPDGMTLKYVFANRSTIRLVGKSHSYRTQRFGLDDVSVQGIVVRIERDL